MTQQRIPAEVLLKKHVHLQHGSNPVLLRQIDQGKLTTTAQIDQAAK